MKQLLSVWLVLQREDEAYLNKIITDLGAEYNAPLFTPHLTLFGNIEIELEELKKLLNEVLAEIKTFMIKKTVINQSEAFFKTVFIEFELSEKLKNLFIILSQKTDKRDVATFKPHISLIYKTMPKDEKLKIIKKLDIKDEFTIGSVYINASKIGDTDHNDIKNWRTLYKKTLI